MNFIRVLSFSVFLVSCATNTKHKAEEVAPPPLLSPNAPATSSPAAETTTEKAPAQTSTPTTAVAGATTPASATTAATETTASTPAAKAHAKGVDPKQALKWLQNGNTRFVKGYLRKDGQGKKDIARLATGQHPHSVILSCSDSRVPPEIVFDQKLGEVFTVRTAGEALDNNVIGSIEYAVEHLGARLILVMGHTSCGAIKAAMQTPTGGNAGTAALSQLVADIQPRIQATMAKGKGSADVARESMANAQGVVEDLKKLSPLLRAAAEKGEIEIKPALYHLNSGAVSFE